MFRKQPHTGRDHSLDEVLDIAEHDTKPLDGVRLARLGLHGPDLNALHYRVAHDGAIGRENAPASAVSKKNNP